MSTRLIPALVCLYALLTLGGCGEPSQPSSGPTPGAPSTPGTGDTGQTPPPAPAQGAPALSVGCPLATARVYRLLQCTAQVTDQNGDPVSAVFTWRSSDESLARVSASGLVTPLTPGSVTLTVTATLDSATLAKQVSLAIETGGQPTVHSVSVVRSETWHVEDNPHLVQGQLEVGGASNPILTLEPGVIVLFAPEAELRITTGALQALGSADAPILLNAWQASAPRGSWRGVVFSGSGGSSHLDFVTLSQCGGGLGSGACLSLEKGATATVHHVTVRGSGSVGVQVADDGSAFDEGSGPLGVVDGAGLALRLGANAVGRLSSLGPVTGNAPDAVEVRGSVTTSQTWPNPSAPYVLPQSLSVQGPTSPTLTLAAGCQLRFQSGAGFSVGATAPGDVVLAGTEEAPVLLTADSATPTPGAWKGLSLGQGGAGGSHLSHVVIEFAGQPFETGEAADLVLGNASGGSTPLLEQVTLRAGSAVGLLMASSGSSLKEGSQGLRVQDNALGPIVLDADQVGSLPADTSVTGNGVDGVVVRASNVSHGQTWPRLDAPYLIRGLIQVRGIDAYVNPVLNLLPGTELRFAPSAGLVMGPEGFPGGLSAVGTPEAPIRFLPDGDSAAPGQGWAGLTFWYAAVSTLSYVDVTSGGLAGRPGGGNLNVFRELGAFVTHSTFRDSAGCGATVSTGQEPDSSVVTTDFTYAGYHNAFPGNAGGAQCATSP